jgi:hypothetical protein
VATTSIFSAPAVSKPIETTQVVSAPVSSLAPITDEPVTVKEGQTVLQVLQEASETGIVASTKTNVETTVSEKSKLFKPMTIIILVLGAILFFKIKSNKK